jgi:membrane-bound lytic murein transglycosylase MltF
LSPRRRRSECLRLADLWSDVSEIVVTGAGAPEIRSVDDLSGREVFVRLSSSYFQSLWHLNEDFGRRGLPPLKIKPAPEGLEDEDILEMVSAGLVPKYYVAYRLIVDAQAERERAKQAAKGS